MAESTVEGQSRGLGHLPFTEATGIRIPLGVPLCLRSKPKSGRLFSFLDLEELEQWCTEGAVAYNTTPQYLEHSEVF